MSGLLIIPIVYVLLILCYLKAWRNLPLLKIERPAQVFVSVIIAVRNEEQCIKPLLESLTRQSYSKDLFEVLFVNDHSDDKTVEVIEDSLKESSLRYRVIFLPVNEQGKKAAIAAGIKQAKGDLMVTTDADCSMREQWLVTIAGVYEKYNPVMMLLPVVLTGSNFFSQLQSQEFLSLTGVTGASLAMQKPLMCNGANLAFKKTAYENANKEALRNDIATGDDTFLMLNVFKTNPGKVMYVKSADVLATTPAQPSVAAFLSQRIRWTSKVKMYTEVYISLTGILVLMMAALQLFSVAFLMGSDLTAFANVTWIAAVFILKMIVDYFFIRQTSDDLKQPFSLTAFICWQFLYPFYILITGIAAWAGGYVWKGRKYS